MAASPRLPDAIRAFAQGAERRIHRRVQVVTAAWLRVDGEQRFPAECLNVTMGGAAVLTDVTLSSGRVVQLELTLGKQERHVVLSCEVVRARGAELGLRFIALDRPSLEAILSLL